MEVVVTQQQEGNGEEEEALWGVVVLRNTATSESVEVESVRGGTLRQLALLHPAASSAIPLLAPGATRLS